MENYPFEWKLEADQLEVKVRLSIFIIISACAGLPALVWSVSDLIQHRKNGHRISVFILLLLLTDFFELILSPYLLIKELLNELPQDMDWTCWVLWSVRGTSRNCGIVLNPLVAIQGILSVKYPLHITSVFSKPLFIFSYILLFLYILIIWVFVHEHYFIIYPFVFVVSMIAWRSSCFSITSCFAGHHSHTTRKPDHHISAIFIFTLLVLFLPFIALSVFFSVNPLFSLPFPGIYIPYFLINVRLISDPLLCVLVCRQNLIIQTSQSLKGVV